MRPSRAAAAPFLGRLGWTHWMWSLTLGCIISSVWSSSPSSDSSVAAAGPPGVATSYTHPEHPLHSGRHHTSPISIYRSPAFLRSGHVVQCQQPSCIVPERCAQREDESRTLSKNLWMRIFEVMQIKTL
ncbi:neurexin 3 isoform X20 [Labeo rohita]|uniref:Neurexin 3 isoform X20 n=1 Tax=Labeo rohita TaxID=84645 RepID=A0A498LM28_LABRO|nr:neurexin 3 isoform X20 [Labeo rohita]